MLDGEKLMNNTAFTKYLTITGWISILCLNLGAIFYLYYANRYKNDSKFDSWFFVFMHWALALMFAAVMVGVTSGIIEITNFTSINFSLYSIRNPPIWAMNLTGIVGIVLSLIPLWLRNSHRLTSRCTGECHE